jgi:hypothetical protein
VEVVALHAARPAAGVEDDRDALTGGRGGQQHPGVERRARPVVDPQRLGPQGARPASERRADVGQPHGRARRPVGADIDALEVGAAVGRLRTTTTRRPSAEAEKPATTRSSGDQGGHRPVEADPHEPDAAARAEHGQQAVAAGSHTGPLSPPPPLSV